MVQWLRLHTPNAGGLGLILGQGIRSHVLQLRPGIAKQINILKNISSYYRLICDLCPLQNLYEVLLIWR